ncbi:MAG: DUF1287 domain-containing protein [Candidatus Angelobacter sp.]
MSRRLALFALVAAGILAAQLRPQSSIQLSRQAFLHQFAAAALDRTHHVVRYDPAYVRLAYPGGDVPAETGVCTDEVIRAYRAVGIDLQKEVHEDMAANFSAYPRKWGRREPDPNIDHRRVPNLMVFFSRKGESLPITDRAEDYAPGDLVTWDLGRGLTHIGMVVDRKAMFARRYMIVHNIGQGPKMEDVLFDWKITGHYRYFGPERGVLQRPPNVRKPSQPMGHFSL